MEKRFIVGSRAFFSPIEGFQSKDTDTLVWTDENTDFKHYKQSSMSGRCEFLWAVKTKKELLAFAQREQASGLEFGKFLVTDFANEIGLTIEDLKAFADAYLPKLDARHKYQEIIYNSYIANNGFYLTDKQREDAYEEYNKDKKEE